VIEFVLFLFVFAVQGCSYNMRRLPCSLTVTKELRVHAKTLV
jgi:hypothetical protein